MRGYSNTITGLPDWTRLWSSLPEKLEVGRRRSSARLKKDVIDSIVFIAYCSQQWMCRGVPSGPRAHVAERVSHGLPYSESESSSVRFLDKREPGRANLPVTPSLEAGRRCSRPGSPW